VSDDEKTDPGGHAFEDDLPPEQLAGAPAWAQRLFDETRALRNELRAHAKDDELRYGQEVAANRARLTAAEARIAALEELVHPRTDPAPNGAH
jgi:phosphoketolase